MATKKNIGIWACDKCGTLYTSKYAADICCKQYHCEVCRVETPRYILKCESCQEKARFDKAAKMSVEEYEAANPGNMVYWNDNYYGSVDDLLEHLADEGIAVKDLPTYCYGTTRVYMRLEPGSILEHLEEELDCEGVHFCDEAYKEFKKFAEEWNKKYEEYCFYWDSKTVILIPDELKKDWPND